MSHRSKEFTTIITKTEKDLRTLMKIPNNFKVLFLQGGATLQFAAVPWNLLGGAKKTANYLVTGHWSEKALEECKKYGKVNEVIPLKEVKGIHLTLNNIINKFLINNISHKIQKCCPCYKMEH